MFQKPSGSQSDRGSVPQQMLATEEHKELRLGESGGGEVGDTPNTLLFSL